MKNYSYTKKEVENLVNTKILPSIANDKPTDDKRKRVETIKFLYAVNRISALEAYLRLALIDLVGTDQYTKIGLYFWEDKQ